MYIRINLYLLAITNENHDKEDRGMSNTLRIETPHSTHSFSNYIKPIIEGFGYAFAALALYAIPMGAAYLLFQSLFN